MAKRVAIYTRVSTDRQTLENQRQALMGTAERRGWEVVAVYTDAGISGAKGRAERPGLDDLLKAASKGGFDVVMAWSIDRLGRSLIDLLGTIRHLEACGVDLYFDQQSIDTTTPTGRLMFQICGAFAEFERSMIRQRISAGLSRARAQGKRLGRVVPARPVGLAMCRGRASLHVTYLDIRTVARGRRAVRQGRNLRGPLQNSNVSAL